jgi:hypothetical protein
VGRFGREAGCAKYLIVLCCVVLRFCLLVIHLAAAKSGVGSSSRLRVATSGRNRCLSDSTYRNALTITIPLVPVPVLVLVRRQEGGISDWRVTPTPPAPPTPPRPHVRLFC